MQIALDRFRFRWKSCWIILLGAFGLLWGCSESGLHKHRLSRDAEAERSDLMDQLRDPRRSREAAREILRRGEAMAPHLLRTAESGEVETAAVAVSILADMKPPRIRLPLQEL